MEWRHCGIPSSGKRYPGGCPNPGLLLGLLMLSVVSACTDLTNSRASDIVFMEPAGPPTDGRLPEFMEISDPARLRTYFTWMNCDAARMATDLYRRSWRAALPDQTPAALYVALVPGGNEAGVGFRLRRKSGWEKHNADAYIRLAPEEWLFHATLFHETGHAVLYMLNGGKPLPGRKLASISHTTAALTDRATAFDEGFSIHLETLVAHLSRDPLVEQRYHHERFLFGPAALSRGEYFRQSMDLLSFSQTRSRYHEICENVFAFAPAYTGPDYLRVQLEKSRDFATVRDADQLLQSEGFHASFFFSLLARGDDFPSVEFMRNRQDRILAALYQMFQSLQSGPDSPYLLHFIETYLQEYPDDAAEVIDVLLDLSHGVFVDRQAPLLWRAHYLGALRLDLKERENEEIFNARREWRAKVLKNPKILYSLLGPQVRCEIPDVTVRLIAFGDTVPLSFDVNTVEEGVMRMIPAITDTEVQHWKEARSRQAFADEADFRERSGLRQEALKAMVFKEIP
jgi:hypothetical protein